MIEQRALVTKVMPGQVEVEVALESSCSGCESSQNCGVGTVAKAFTGKTQRLNVTTNLILHKGQWVKIGTAEQGVLLLAALTYLLPLVGLLIVGGVAHHWLVIVQGRPEWLAIIFGLGGGYIFHRFAKWLIDHKVQMQPTIYIVSVDY